MSVDLSALCVGIALLVVAGWGGRLVFALGPDHDRPAGEGDRDGPEPSARLDTDAGIEDALVLVLNPDAPLGRRLAWLFDLKERRRSLDARQADRLGRAEEAVTADLRRAGVVRTRAFTYRLGPEGRVQRFLPT